MVKAAVVAPIPTARIATTMVVKPTLRRTARIA
jgi:hypothetical protein